MTIDLPSAQQRAIAEHSHHRFKPIEFRGETWDLSHLDPFAYHREIILDRSEGASLIVEIVVIFSCHCFTHSLDKDQRPAIPADELYQSENEVRVLDKDRYILSKTLLRDILNQLPARKIVVAMPGVNYVTYERQTGSAVEHYGVFFEVMKAKSRKNRLILRIQSAYLREPTQRHKTAKKVGFDTLLKAAHEGRTIKP